MRNLLRNPSAITVERLDGVRTWAWCAIDSRVGPPFRVYCATTEADARKLADEMLRSLPAAVHAVAGEAEGVYERAGIARRVYNKHGCAID